MHYQFYIITPWVKKTDLIFQKTDFFFRFPEGRVNYGEVTLVNFSAGEANLEYYPNKTFEIFGGPFVEMKDVVKEKGKISNLSPVTWQVGGPLIKEKAGFSIEVDEGDKHSCFLLHLQPSHKVGRPLNTHAVSCLIVSRQKYISSISSWSTTGPSAGLSGFILAILARQRARDSCEVRSAVRRGDDNEEEEEKEGGEVEKAIRGDIDIDEEKMVRAPSPIAAPTLCILKRLVII